MCERRESTAWTHSPAPSRACLTTRTRRGPVSHCQAIPDREYAALRFRRHSRRVCRCGVSFGGADPRPGFDTSADRIRVERARFRFSRWRYRVLARSCLACFQHFKLHSWSSTMRSKTLTVMGPLRDDQTEFVELSRRRADCNGTDPLYCRHALIRFQQWECNINRKTQKRHKSWLNSAPQNSSRQIFPLLDGFSQLA